MTSRPHPTSVSRLRGEKRLPGRFKPNGSSAIDNTPIGVSGGTIVGRGFTVARVGVGLYDITTDSPYGILVHVDARLWSSTIVGGGLFRPTSVTYNAKTTVVRLLHQAETGGTMAAADIASAADNFVSFDLVFSDAKVQRA